MTFVFLSEIRILWILSNYFFRSVTGKVLKIVKIGAFWRLIQGMISNLPLPGFSPNIKNVLLVQKYNDSTIVSKKIKEIIP